jgi:serine/threonine-protein kinase HipA
VNLALKIGDENRPDWIQERHWKAFAEASGANPRIVWKRMAELSATIPGKARGLLASLDLGKEEHEMLERICSIVDKRAARLAGLKAVRQQV